MHVVLKKSEGRFCGAAAGASNIMQRDGEGLPEQQTMERKHDYVRIINLFMEHETTPPSYTHAHTLVSQPRLSRGKRESGQIPIRVWYCIVWAARLHTHT